MSLVVSLLGYPCSTSSKEVRGAPLWTNQMESKLLDSVTPLQSCEAFTFHGNTHHALLLVHKLYCFWFTRPHNMDAVMIALSSVGKAVDADGRSY